jgi:hypothetical protein
MEDREKEIAEIRVPLILLFIPRSGIPIESLRHRAMSRPTGRTGRCAGLPGEAAGARRACTESYFGQGSGVAPIHALGYPVHRLVPSGTSRKIDQRALPYDSNTMKRSRAGFKDLCRVT